MERVSIPDEGAETIERTFRQESSRILATLIDLVKDFSVAEDALQDASLAALQHWPREGVPRQPAAWLTVIARRRAIDHLRRDATLARKQPLLEASALLEAQVAELESGVLDDEANSAASFSDERLKLIFTCCHPALALEARVALTLRTLGGLSMLVRQGAASFELWTGQPAPLDVMFAAARQAMGVSLDE